MTFYKLFLEERRSENRGDRFNRENLSQSVKKTAACYDLKTRKNQEPPHPVPGQGAQLPPALGPPSLRWPIPSPSSRTQPHFARPLPPEPP